MALTTTGAYDGDAPRFHIGFEKNPHVSLDIIIIISAIS